MTPAAAECKLNVIDMFFDMFGDGVGTSGPS